MADQRIREDGMRRAVVNRIFRPIEYRWKTLRLAAVPLRDPFVLVTGADRTHYRSLGNLLRSAAKWEPDLRCIVYDLGLTPPQLSELSAEFPAREIRRFEYAKYPAYFDIRVNAGEYAWKPIIFSDVFNELQCSVCWFDAGNIVTGPLTLLRKTVQWTGFYSPIVKDTIEKWTHPKTLEILKVEDSIRKRPPLAGGCVAASYRFENARRFVQQWRECALEKECIAPAGSNRYNHRQDLSVLSILVYQMRLPLFMSSYKPGFIFQQDAD
jgi:hypothetical protein